MHVNVLCFNKVGNILCFSKGNILCFSEDDGLLCFSEDGNVLCFSKDGNVLCFSKDGNVLCFSNAGNVLCFRAASMHEMKQLKPRLVHVLNHQVCPSSLLTSLLRPPLLRSLLLKFLYVVIWIHFNDKQE